MKKKETKEKIQSEQVKQIEECLRKYSNLSQKKY